VPDFTEITSGLRFPEGPIAMDDGSVVLVEMFKPGITRVAPDGAKTLVAEIPGGPNGAAIGPDGALYLCNNGGCFTPVEMGGLLLPGPFDPDRYIGGRIQRVDLSTGAVTDLYTECDGHPLRAPNDLVFDAHGGFWFTDHGIRHGRSKDRTGIYYAQPDRSSITEVVFPVDSPAGLSGMQLLDSLAVDGDGNVCVATLVNGGITVIAPDGEVLEHVPTGDVLTTNICFGGPDLRTAFITASGTGRLLAMPWPRPGLRLAHHA